MPTTAEDAAINRGIKADPDTRELSAADFAQMVPFREMMRRRGRPRSAVHKLPVKVRLDPQVVEFFRAAGRGWQTRLNAALLAHVKRAGAKRSAARRP